MPYRIHIGDRDYSTWNIVSMDTTGPLDEDISVDPNVHKLFNHDVFDIEGSDHTIQLLHSPIRSSSSIPAVLVLDGNKTYGRERRPESGQTYTPDKIRIKCGRLLYKCIPDDKRLPAFLVPYEIKHIGFSKVYSNLYVTMRFDQWYDKHPRGKLDQVIGSIDVLDHYYEYQLYCKSLHASIHPFQKAATHSLQGVAHDSLLNSILAKYPNIENRTHSHNIFTIDPSGSADLDDGVSIRMGDDGVTYVVSIYIANVTLWIDQLSLWDAFSTRVSTIYLPDKKRPMLPTILSDGLCSLHQGVRRLAFVLDLHVREDEIVDIGFRNAVVRVSTNFAYEDDALIQDPHYNTLFALVCRLSQRYPYVHTIRNSHDVVSYLMIAMNYYCAKELQAHHTGIFRTTVTKTKASQIPESLPDDVRRFVAMWNNTSGCYTTYDTSLNHSLLNIDAYIHITSPIRRLVDLLNLIQFQTITSMFTFSESAGRFFEKWLGELDYINTAMRSIRKLQCDSLLLDRCQHDVRLLEAVYDGYLFDKLTREDGLYQYTVYLPELKLSSRVILRAELNNYTVKMCKLYWFINEDSFKRKIRVQVLDE